MDDVSSMKIVHRFKHLFDRLRCIFLCEFSLLTDAVEKLSAGSQLCDDVILILSRISCESQCNEV
jgi:hypothetical protein